MADNVNITPGSGVTVLADELTDGVLGTGLAQYVKVMDGTVNSSNKWIIGADGAALFVAAKASTPTTASVSASASVQTLLASNSNRYGATVYNDSSATLYLKLGSGASTSSFTLLMAANSYYEVPFHYSGIITGLWSSATGAARITELTA